MKDYYRRRRRRVTGLARAGRSRAVHPGRGAGPVRPPVPPELAERPARSRLGALDELERSTGQPHYTILRLRVDNPGLTSKEWAPRLSELLRRPVTPGAFRQALQRARREFARRLVAEVRASLAEPTTQALEEELADLELLEYCRPYLKRGE